MHLSVTVRDATAADLLAVCQIAEDLAAVHHQAWPSVFAPASGAMRDEQHWRESILGEGRAAFVAESSGTVVGFITLACHTENHTLLQPVTLARVSSVCVAGPMRGKGIGRLLMRQAEAWAVEQGADEMRLVVWAFNEPAMKLYEELGYKVRSHTLGKALERSGA